MAEETKEDVTEKPNVDKVLELAKQLGYNPDFQGDGKRTAEEFILESKNIQKTMANRMNRLQEEVDESKRSLSGIQSHLKAVYEHQVKTLKNEIEELKYQRSEAIKDEDHEKVRSLDGRINELEKESETKPTEPAPMSPEFKKWVDQNEWYRDDSEMRQWAETQARINPKYAGLSQGTFYKTLATDVRAMFPDRFETKDTKKDTEDTPVISVVESGDTKAIPKQKFTKKDLNDSQRQVWKDIESNGIPGKDGKTPMTLNEYIDQLVEIGQLS